MKEKLKGLLRFIANPHLLLCLAAAWMLTSGWAYILLGLGIIFDIKWMLAAGGGYVAFLWIPMCPIKLVTAALAIALLHKLFPDDRNTLAVLKRLYVKAKRSVRKKKRPKKNNI